jgi:uncharacterized protein
MAGCWKAPSCPTTRRPASPPKWSRSGARARSAAPDPGDLPLLALHDRQTLPIGVAVELRDEPARWFGAFKVSRTRLGDEVLELVNDRALTGLSVGFLPVPGGDRWNAARTRVERIRALAHHVGVLPFPAFASARIAAVRSASSPTPLLDLARLRHG